MSKEMERWLDSVAPRKGNYRHIRGIKVRAISLVREGDDAVVYVEFMNGEQAEVIREPCDSPFSHNVYASGIAKASQ